MTSNRPWGGSPLTIAVALPWKGAGRTFLNQSGRSQTQKQTASARTIRVGPVLFYVDHTARFERNTGIQRCVRSLSRALVELGVPLQPVVWNRSRNTLEAASDQHRQHLARWQGPNPHQWMDWATPQPAELAPARWLVITELVSGPHNPNADQLEQEAKRRGLQVAWLFHDAIPVRWAHLYGQQAAPAAQAHADYMRGLARFDQVIANSKTTEAHLRQFWTEQKLHPRAHLSSVPLAEELPGTARLSLPPEAPASPIVLCVSSLEPRKNHRGLLKALAALVSEQRWPHELQLVLVGWPNDARVVEQVRRAIALNLPMRWEADADDRRLLELYQQSIACVYPSLEEGFGLPVAESLWHRRPCLCSNQGALAELAQGGGCLTVNTNGWKGLKTGLLTISTHSAARSKLSAEISQRTTRTWRQVAHEWIDRMTPESAHRF
jgi:glycosyltransferase involved in cell wall biosynthesis